VARELVPDQLGQAKAGGLFGLGEEGLACCLTRRRGVFYSGHRLAHPLFWDLLPRSSASDAEEPCAAVPRTLKRRRARSSRASSG